MGNARGWSSCRVAAFFSVFVVTYAFPGREEAGLAAGERLWKRGKVTTEDLVGGRVMTSGKTSGSFTSSSLTVREGGLDLISEL